MPDGLRECGCYHRVALGPIEHHIQPALPWCRIPSSFVYREEGLTPFLAKSCCSAGSSREFPDDSGPPSRDGFVQDVLLLGRLFTRLLHQVSLSTDASPACTHLRPLRLTHLDFAALSGWVVGSDHCRWYMPAPSYPTWVLNPSVWLALSSSIPFLELGLYSTNSPNHWCQPSV
jgi:hypothetical protein